MIVLFCCALLCVHFSFTIILMGKRAGCFALFVFLVSRDCCVALPHGVTGLSAVCYCGNSQTYSLFDGCQNVWNLSRCNS